MPTRTLVELIESTDLLHSLTLVARPLTAGELSKEIGISQPQCQASLHRLASLGVVRSHMPHGEVRYQVIPDQVLDVVATYFA